MSKEPHVKQGMIEQGFRLLTLNHTLISYLSTLGAHRDKRISPHTLELFDDVSVYIITMLSDQKINSEYQPLKKVVANYIESISINDDQSNNDLLVLQQLALILDILPEIISLIGVLNNKTAQ